MRSSRITTLFATIALLVPLAATAQPRITPGDWRVVDAQPPGTRVVVQSVGGEEVHGALTESGPGELRVEMGEGPFRAWPRGAVLRVWTEATVRDSLKDGTTKGALAGVGIAVTALAFAYAACRGGCEAPSMGVPFAMAAGVGAAAGAGVGAALDRGHERPWLLYEAAPDDKR